MSKRLAHREWFTPLVLGSARWDENSALSQSRGGYLRVATGRREYGEGGSGLEWTLMGMASARDEGSARLKTVSIFMGVAIGYWALSNE